MMRQLLTTLLYYRIIFPSERLTTTRSCLLSFTPYLVFTCSDEKRAIGTETPPYTDCQVVAHVADSSSRMQCSLGVRIPTDVALTLLNQVHKILTSRQVLIPETPDL